MSYIRKIIGGDEKLIGIARLHWIYIAQGMLWFIGCVAFAQLFDTAVYYGLSMLPNASDSTAMPLLAISDWLTPFALVFGAFICSIYVIKVLTTEIGLTTRRIIYKRGWWFVNTKEIEIEEIRGENLDLGYLGRVLDYGYLNLDCRFIGDIALPAIEKPAQFLRALHKMRADVTDTVSLVMGDKTLAIVENPDDSTPDLNRDTPALQKDEHLDQSEVIAQAVAEAMRHMPATAAPGVPVPPAAPTVDPAMVAAIIEQVVPAMAERMAAQVTEKVAEKVSEEMEAQGIIPVPEDIEIPPDAPTPPVDPLADPSRLEPEGPDEELLQEFDDAAGLANETEPHPPKPAHVIH